MAEANLSICVITLLPKLIEALHDDGVIGGALKTGKINLTCINPRDFTDDIHQTVDDAPYGGGPGMVLKPEPLAAAIDAAKQQLPQAPVWAMAVDGDLFDAALASSSASLSQLILVCGRYQGIDQRILDSRVDRLVSVGDVVVSGGELPAMLIIDAIGRFVPDVLGSDESAAQDSFATDQLAPACYTRPAEFAGMHVPKVLLSGDHAAIASWRQEQAAKRTQQWEQKRSRKR